MNGRVALVTGAGRGIGRAVALGLASAGGAVALLARSADQLDRVAAEIEALGARALAVPTELAHPAEVDAALDRVAAELGPVDVLINNAAVVTPLGPSAVVDIDAYATALDINVIAVARLSFALLPGMLERGWGRIVNVSSGIVAHPGAMIGANAYVTSKAALEAHTLNLAAELAGSGVTVNVYRPGSVDTAMQGFIRAQDPAAIGAALHARFTRSHAEGALISSDVSARSLVARLTGEQTGQIWDVSDSVLEPAAQR